MPERDAIDLACTGDDWLGLAVFVYASGPWAVIEELPEEAKNPFGDWIDAMGWVEADEEKLERPEQGWLWIHRAA